MTAAYEMIIGLETHVELRTKSKAFCSCANQFGAAPNTLCCPVCMGLPGALPVLNEQAVRLAAAAGLALGCTVHPWSRFDRKHYFYPDLPKGYQITQLAHPLCEHGRLTVENCSGGETTIRIARIHLEEDAGKLMHGAAGETLLDLNRCGVPLIEIVTEPDIRSAEEATAYLRGLRAALLYAEVSDGKMNEGSLRCDVNLSVRRPGEPLGERTELKNLNSFQSIERAIAAEFARQVSLREAGQIIQQETLRFDVKAGITIPIRRKEVSEDYRYMPEPDLPWLHLAQETIKEIRSTLPVPPHQRKADFVRLYGLSPYAAEQLTEDRSLSDYLECAAKAARHPKAAANLLMGEVFAQLTLRGQTEKTLPFAAEHLAKLGDMAAEGRVNSSTAKRILSVMFEEDCDPAAYAAEHRLLTIGDEEALTAIARQVLEAYPAMAEAYLHGKESILKALMGKAMAKTEGRADAEKLQAILLSLLHMPQT